MVEHRRWNNHHRSTDLFFGSSARRGLVVEMLLLLLLLFLCRAAGVPRDSRIARFQQSLYVKGNPFVAPYRILFGLSSAFVPVDLSIGYLL